MPTPDPGEPSATAQAAAATSEAAAATTAAAAATEEAAAATVEAAAASIAEVEAEIEAVIGAQPDAASVAEGEAAVAEAASLAGHLADARELLAGGLISELVGEVRTLAAAVGHLADTWEVRFDEVENDRRRGLIVTALAVAALVAVGLGVGRLNNLAETNRENGRILVACTVPYANLPPEQQTLSEADLPTRCFERGQAGTAAAVSAIVFCERLPDTATIDEIKACIVDELTPGPPP